MKAVHVERIGTPLEVLYGERPVPVPTARQVLIEVHAAGVNPRDRQLGEGRYAFRRLSGRLPTILGSDVSGVVVDRGRRVTRFAPGDEVLAMQTTLGGMGGFAEYVAVHESAVARKPAALGHVEAAALPVVGLTAWQALARGDTIAPGRVTVLGATGGVGHLAVQLAHRAGATVTAVCGPDKAELAVRLGADAVIDHRSQRLADALGAPQDVLLDTVGTGSLRSVRSLLAPGGRYLTTVPGTRAVAEWAATAVTGRIGDRRSARLVLVLPDGPRLAALAGAVAAGDLRILVHDTWPLADAGRALALLGDRQVRGKIVLTVR